MSDRIRILVVSRSQPPLRAIEAALSSRREFDCTYKLISNGHTNPLHGVDPMPDVLLLRFDPAQLAELTTLADMDPSRRPPLIVVGPPANPEAMRLAIRSGAKDFLVEPLRADDLVAALSHIGREPRRDPSRATGIMDVVVGAAGGVGASFIACNLAHLTVAAAGRSCLLLDLDLNYAPLAHFLDLKPERGLLEALGVLESLDEHALQGYVAKHRSGLHLMCSVPSSVVLSRDVQSSRVESLLQILAMEYQHVIVDSPHQIDAVNATLFGRARSVLVVLEQSVCHVKNAAHLLRILTKELGLPRDRIKIVLNRYSKRGTVQLDDVRRTLDVDEVFAVPNHYELSLNSIDTAKPLFDLDKDGAVARAMRELLIEIGNLPRPARSGLLSRLPLFTRT
jgi:pilus assembly protein CpaE